MSPDQKTTLGAEIVENWHSCNDSDRDQWLKDLPKWLEAYQGRDSEKNIPFEGASNLHVPVTATVVETIHPRMMRAAFGPEPIVHFKPAEPNDVEKAERRSRFLDWAVREEVNLFPVIDRAVLNTLTYGVQFVKAYWDLQIRHVRDKHIFDRNLPFEEIVALLQEEDLRLVEAAQRVNNTTIEATVAGQQFNYEVEETPLKWIIYTEREEVVRDAPSVTMINPEDIVMNSDAAYDIQQTDYIYHRYRLTYDQIKREVQKGVFVASDEELEELKRCLSRDVEPGDNTYDIKAHREVVTGTRATYREGAPERLDLIDAYMRMDINDDGYEEEVIVTVPFEKPDIILRCVRLEEVYRHGMRPFTAFYCNPVADSIWAIGIPQVLEGLQKEFNVIHNQRVDSGTIANMPFGWYVPTAGLNPERYKLTPGVMNPVDDINSVRMHTPANYTAWGFQEENSLWTLVERRTKVNDLSLGRIGESQGAARTARGVQALSEQQAAGFDILIRRFQEGFKALLQQILALYAQYMPPGKEFRILGEIDKPEYVVSRDDLTGHQDIVFSGNALSTDREVQRNSLVFLTQSLLAPAAWGMLLQLGITNPAGLAEWFRHVLKVFDVPAIERIIQIPPQVALLRPEQVVARVTAGERVKAQEGEDHQTIIEMLQDWLVQDGMYARAEAKAAVNEHIQRRGARLQQEMMKMMQLLQMAMMQQQGMMGGPMGMGGPAPAQLPPVPGFGGAPMPPPSQPEQLNY
jgi:hypothetical protein